MDVFGEKENPKPGIFERKVPTTSRSYRPENIERWRGDRLGIWKNIASTFGIWNFTTKAFAHMQWMKLALFVAFQKFSTAVIRAYSWVYLEPKAYSRFLLGGCFGLITCVLRRFLMGCFWLCCRSGWQITFSSFKVLYSKTLDLCQGKSMDLLALKVWSRWSVGVTSCAPRNSSSLKDGQIGNHYQRNVFQIPSSISITVVFANKQP